MPGGVTTHGGIEFQDGLAVVKLAEMLAGLEVISPNLGSVVSVRLESPDPVDDIVVEYSSGRKEYIQAKINVRAGDDAWDKMWKHFYDQFQSPDFKRGPEGDIIILALGNNWPGSVELQSLLAHAASAASVAELSDVRLKKGWRELFGEIRSSLEKLDAPPDDVALLSMFGHLRVKIEAGGTGMRDTDAFPNVVYNLLKNKFTRAEVIYDVLLNAVLRRATLI